MLGKSLVSPRPGSYPVIQFRDVVSQGEGDSAGVSTTTLEQQNSQHQFLRYFAVVSDTASSGEKIVFNKSHQVLICILGTLIGFR